MIAVVDTNVIVSGLFYGGVPKRLLSHSLRGGFTMVATTSMAEEYEEVVAEVGERLSVEGASVAFHRLMKRLLIVPAAAGIPPICRDSDDDKFVICALGFPPPIPVIVSGDRDLLVLNGRFGLEVISPREYLKQLGDPGPA